MKKGMIVNLFQLVAIRAAEIFTNHPNQSKVALTALMVLSHDKLIISKEVNFVAEGTFKDDPAGFERFKNRFIDATTLYLSDKFKLKIESKSGEQTGEFPILVKLSHNASANYRLLLYGGAHGRGHLRLLRGHIYEGGRIHESQVPFVYLAHEAAHLMLGANDEYAPQAYGRTVHLDDPDVKITVFVLVRNMLHKKKRLTNGKNGPHPLNPPLPTLGEGEDLLRNG